MGLGFFAAVSVFAVFSAAAHAQQACKTMLEGAWTETEVNWVVGDDENVTLVSSLSFLMDVDGTYYEYSIEANYYEVGYFTPLEKMPLPMTPCRGTIFWHDYTGQTWPPMVANPAIWSLAAPNVATALASFAGPAIGSTTLLRVNQTRCQDMLAEVKTQYSARGIQVGPLSESICKL